MLYSSGKKSTNKQRSRTPLSNNSAYSPFKGSKKQTQQNETNSVSKLNLKLKTKQRFGVLTALQDIYAGLAFNQFEAYPIQNIINAKKNIEKLYVYLQEQPICPKHNDLLNLYCQNQKQVICVSCVYKGGIQNHKNHKIKKIQTVEKVLQYETIRIEEKGRSLVDQIKNIKQQIFQIQNQVSDRKSSISNSTITIINEAIEDLNRIKLQLQKNLGLSYKRTQTIINRYSECLESMTNMIQFNLKKSSVMNPLSKYLLLKELNKESILLQDLINKFHDNKALMECWKKSSRQFQKLIIKKKASLSVKNDAYVVSQF